MFKLVTALVLSFPAVYAAPAQAAPPYPTKSVTMIVPFPPGGRTDVIGRVVAQYMQAPLGKPVVVLNRPGASSVLGANEVAEAKPDGHTLGFFSTSIVTAQYTVPTPVRLSDFELIAIVNADPAAVAVKQDAKWKSLRDVVFDAKKAPGTLRVGMIPGASAQIFASGLARSGGIELVNVPFKGDSDGAIALAGGHIDLHVAVPVSYKSLVASNKVRILAVAADQRSELYGELPTFRENGVDLSVSAFHGVYVPKGTPADVKDKLAVALQKALEDPSLRNRMNELGAAPVFLASAEAQTYLEQQDITYREIVDALGLRAVPAK